MSMTKKERAIFDAAIDRAETLAALRWTNPVARDVYPPECGESGTRYTAGWDYNSYSGTIFQAWSGCVSNGHGVREEGKYNSASQGAKSLFSTKSLAISAMRHEMENESAKKLRSIDRMLANENREAQP